MTETSIQREIRLAIGSMSDVVAWRNNVGTAMHARGGVVRYGLAIGSGDLIAIMRPGTFVSIEVKTPHGRETPEQRLWAELVRSMGGHAFVVLSVEDGGAQLEGIRRERR